MTNRPVILPLQDVYPKDGEVLNGWSGYTSNGVFKQWYFVESVVLGYVEGLRLPPSQEFSEYGYSFAHTFHGGFKTADEAKLAFRNKLIDWWVSNEQDYFGH